MTWGTVKFARVAFPNKQAVETWLREQPKSSISDRMKNIVERCKKGVAVQGGVTVLKSEIGICSSSVEIDVKFKISSL